MQKAPRLFFEASVIVGFTMTDCDSQESFERVGLTELFLARVGLTELFLARCLANVYDR